MPAAASRREFDVLLFRSLDRFSREGVLLVLTRLQRLSEYGVKYKSLQESYIDTTNESGHVVTAVVAKLAELEQKRLNARVMEGLENARAHGRTLGRPRLVVDPARISSLRKDGQSLRQIAVTLKLCIRSIQRILKTQKRASA
jgi:DNA invertase Pin-like site-specific DNA recombinase